jgi:hypothetical protein
VALMTKQELVERIQDAPDDADVYLVDKEEQDTNRLRSVELVADRETGEIYQIILDT